MPTNSVSAFFDWESFPEIPFDSKVFSAKEIYNAKECPNAIFNTINKLLGVFSNNGSNNEEFFPKTCMWVCRRVSVCYLNGTTVNSHRDTEQLCRSYLILTDSKAPVMRTILCLFIWGILILTMETRLGPISTSFQCLLWYEYFHSTILFASINSNTTSEQSDEWKELNQKLWK